MTRIWGFDVQQLRGVLDVIICGVNPTARFWSWLGSMAPEGSRAQEAEMPCRQVCAAGSDMAMARAELELQPPCLAGNCPEIQPVLPLSS